MAIAHLNVSTMSRGKGQSAVAAAAYRAGARLRDERTGELHDYGAKGGVDGTTIVLPPGVESTSFEDLADLWNASEAAEKKTNGEYKASATVAREIDIALPTELDPEQRANLAQGFAAELAAKHGVAAQVSLHDSTTHNPHAHLLFTTRRVGADGALGEKTREWDRRDRPDDPSDPWAGMRGSDLVEHWRRRWQAHHEASLAKAEIEIEPEATDMRSYAEQGINRTPGVHLGPAATAMERRGIRTDRGDANRDVKEQNARVEALEADLAEIDSQIEEAKKRLRDSINQKQGNGSRPNEGMNLNGRDLNRWRGSQGKDPAPDQDSDAGPDP